MFTVHNIGFPFWDDDIRTSLLPGHYSGYLWKRAMRGLFSDSFRPPMKSFGFTLMFLAAYN